MARAVAVLAALGCLGHILVYAPQDILFCRLATTRTILNIDIDILWFVLWRCWLHSAAWVTYWCMLPKTSSFAALPQRELSRVLRLKCYG